MRTIKFRGKTFSKKWICGFLHKATGSDSLMIQINSFDSFGVNPDTVGQFTGLTDKNGKEIYEGDIIVLRKRGNSKEVFIVEWVNHASAFCRVEKNEDAHYLSSADAVLYEIIGNIHDNPELLKGGSYE